MSIDTQAIIKEYQKDASDTGSAYVQIALLTARIRHLTEHFKTHKKRPPLKKRATETGISTKKIIVLY